MTSESVSEAGLRQNGTELWRRQRCTAQGGESEFIARLLLAQSADPRPEDLQPLASCGREVLVFHNEFRSVPRALLMDGPARCGLDGRGLSGNGRTFTALALRNSQLL